jgi:hypothetical protein
MSPWKSALLHLYYFGTGPCRSWYKTSAAAAGTLPALILFYHRIADDRADSCTTSNGSFARQIAWLQRNVELISLAEVQRRIGSAGNSRLCASITFDDGYAENGRQAIPLLIREKIPCTYFVTVQNILTGEPFPHDRVAGRHFPPNKLDELRAMADAGIEIGCHSYTHPDLSQVSDPAILNREVVVAGEELRDRWGARSATSPSLTASPVNSNCRRCSTWRGKPVTKASAPPTAAITTPATTPSICGGSMATGI